MDDQRHGINLQRSQAGSPKVSIKKNNNKNNKIIKQTKRKFCAGGKGAAPSLSRETPTLSQPTGGPCRGDSRGDQGNTELGAAPALREGERLEEEGGEEERCLGVCCAC